MTKTILVADDSRTIRHVVSLTFVSTDFRVVPADSAKDALDRIKSERPDLVLADVGMPGVDGYQLCQELKQGASTAAIPVVLMAGAFEPFDEVRAEQARADGHIKKPFETQKLIEQVKTLLSAPPRAAAPASAPIAAPPPAMQSYSSPAQRSPAVDDLVARPAPAPVAPQPAFAAPAPAAFAAPVAEQRPLGGGGWDDIPVDDSEPMDMEEAEEGEAFAARAAAYGPSLEPPPAPDPEQEAQRRSVDVWALQDDGSVSPPRSRSVSVPVEEPEFYDEPSGDAPADEPFEDDGQMDAGAPPMVEAIGRAAAPAVAAAVQPHAPGLTKEELVRLAREVIERVAWEVVPELAETIIREEIRRLMAEGD